MREVETDNSVIWPSWCYNTADSRIETEPLKGTTIKSAGAKTKKKRRPISSPDKGTSGLSAIENRCPTPSAFTNASTTSSANATAAAAAAASAAIKMEVKTERLSPASALTDNNSSGSGSNTPSSSYPETPPGPTHPNDRIPSPSLSPAAQLSHAKMQEPPMARNYSDIIRSLAAKYNNANPNDYFNPSKNGLSFGDARFSSFKTNTVSPFAGLMNPLNSGNSSPPSALNTSCHLPAGSTNAKDSNEADLKHMLGVSEAPNSLFSTFGLNSFNSSAVGGVGLPLFPPLVDMGPTQALLNMVRNASSSSNASHIESYIKSASGKRSGELTNNPLDLSSNAPPVKKIKRPLSSNDSVSSESASRSKERSAAPKRTSSVSPKLRPKSTQSTSSAAIADQRATNCLSVCTSSLDRTCPSREAVESVSNWSIDDVHTFVSSIDICAEYADNFREQSIDGISLPLLTEEHLRTTMNMKLGPTLKFRAILAQKIGHCNVCMHCLHCHGSSPGTNDHNNQTPVPSISPTLNVPVVRPNSTGN